MKFLCDRCKTRYSIGDDRVRGKILKIRCKNCANVITVREGMTDADAEASVAPAGAAGSPRSQRPTTMAPPASSTAPASGPGSLAAAPSALDEEWYVSNDGDQEGPFSLAEAQRWVATKPIDADLHCWNEGFDDWLPVDKVSHFRGLRKRPLPPAAPPPLPRLGTGPARVLAQPAQDAEPKPLFAATMASLEKHAPATGTPGIGMPSVGSGGGGSSGPVGMVNGAASGAALSLKSRANGAALPTPNRSQPVRAPSTSTPQAFDIHDSATTLEPAPFEDERATLGEPVASAKRSADASANDAFVKALGGGPSREAQPVPRGPALSDLAANAPLRDDLDDDDDGGDLQIGEVSRVVKLADIIKSGSRSSGERAGVAQRRSGPIATGPLAQRATGAVASLGASNGTGMRPALGADSAALGGGGFLDPSSLAGDTAHQLAAGPPPAAVSHRHGLIALIAVAALLLGAAVVVFVLIGSKDESFDSGLRSGGSIDTTRPDDITHRTGGDTTGPTNPFTGKPITPTRPKYTNTNPTPQHKDPNEGKPPDGMALRPDEVEAEAAKRSTGTQRCYMRSQKGADAILIGDVKKIAVTLTVDKGGTVTDVSLSEHGNDSLGRCLTSAIRAWKFRESSAGITAKITMVFQNG